MIAINFFLPLSVVVISSSAMRNFFCLLLLFFFSFAVKHPGEVGLHVTSLLQEWCLPKTATCGPPFPSPAPRSDLFSVPPHSEGEALSGGDFHRLCYRPLPPVLLLWQGSCCSPVFVSLPVTNWSLESAPLLAVLQAGLASWACLRCRCTGPVLRRASAWVWISLVTVLTLLII